MFNIAGLSKVAFLFPFFALLLAGCSGMQIDPNDPGRWLVKIDTTPSGAELFEGSKYVGITPVFVSVPQAGFGKGERKITVRSPCGEEYVISYAGWALEINVDFNNNKAIIREYATGLSPTAETRELDLKKDGIKYTNGPPTPIRCAIASNELDELTKFIKSGFNINKQSKSGTTPLLFATTKQSYQAVDILLNNGADPNLRNNYGVTPLMQASSKNYIDIVKVLLGNGADPTLTANNGVTALTAANDPTVYEIIKGAISGNYSRNSPGSTIKSPGSIATYTGTGWITRGGYIVTNYHVVDNYRDIKVRFNSLDGNEYPASLAIADEHNDIAILKLETHPEEYKIPGFPIDPKKPKIGEDVFTVGYPKSSVMGKNPKVTDGIISALSGIQDDPRVLQITVPIQSGNSGGPLLNMKGGVVGVTTSSLRTRMTKRGIDVPQNVNYAVKSAYVNILLDSIDVDQNYPMMNIKIDKLENIIPRIKNSIVHVIVQASTPR